jgi:hypothetical protein
MKSILKTYILYLYDCSPLYLVDAPMDGLGVMGVHRLTTAGFGRVNRPLI